MADNKQSSSKVWLTTQHIESQSSHRTIENSKGVVRERKESDLRIEQLRYQDKKIEKRGSTKTVVNQSAGPSGSPKK